MSENTNNTKNHSDSELYSYHVFLFPFVWQQTGPGLKEKSISEKTDLLGFVEKLKDNSWEELKYEIKNVLEYNETNYFYDFVRDILYDREDRSELIIHLQHKEFDNLKKQYRFKVKDKIYHLEIDSIFLHIYNMGVGVLSFHLNNRRSDQNSQEDILTINQYGRRLYPPFLGIKDEFVGTPRQYSNGDFRDGIDLAKGKEIADWMDLGNESFREEFNHYINSDNLQQSTFLLPDFFNQLFPKDILTTDPDNKDGKIYIQALLDDRMFVLCWYGNDYLAHTLNPKNSRRTNPPYLTDDFWYRYVFVDGGLKTCQNDELTIKQLASSTNARWANFGTLYGVSRYSFVCLTGSLDTLKNFNSAFLVNHVQTIYYKMVELCLVQRACLLRFADEVTDTSRHLSEPDLSIRVRHLYEKYIRFVNEVYFREVTAQEQGIELYDLLQEKMRIERNVKDLDTEIQELHNMVMLKDAERRKENEEKQEAWEKAEQRRNEEFNNRMAILGTLFVVPAFITGFYGMNIFNDKLEFVDWPQLTFVFIISILGVIIAAKAMGINNFFSKNRNAAIGLAILLIVIMIFPFFYPRMDTEKVTNTEFILPDTLHIIGDSAQWSIPLKEIKLKTTDVNTEPKN